MGCWIIREGLRIWGVASSPWQARRRALEHRPRQDRVGGGNPSRDPATVNFVSYDRQ